MNGVQADLMMFIDSCLRDASALLLNSRPATVLVDTGDPNQVVTDLDTTVGNSLIERIRKTFPEAGVIEEESGRHNVDARQVWLVDPIDGTSNFSAGSPLYGVMLAVVDGGRPLAAGIALPAFGEFYTAHVQLGVYRNGAPLPPMQTRQLPESLVAYGLDLGPQNLMRRDWELLSILAERTRGIRMSNSVFDAIMVVNGCYGAFIHRSMRIWDVVPIEILVRAAGGSVTDLDGVNFDFKNPFDLASHVFSVVCCGPGLEMPICQLTCSAGETLYA